MRLWLPFGLYQILMPRWDICSVPIAPWQREMGLNGWMWKR